MSKRKDWNSCIVNRCREGNFTLIQKLDIRHGKQFLKIRCNKHDNIFEVRQDRFVNGAGCLACRGDNIANNKIIKTTKEMIGNCKEVHGDKYDYSESVYNTKKLPITIICPVHGKFEQSYLNHIKSKSGCPSCSKYGYKVKSPASFYVLVDEKSGKCKVGVTNNKVHTRIQQINNSGNKNYVLYREIKCTTGREALDLETRVLNSGIIFGDTGTYNGSTEVTELENLPIILEYLEGNVFE